MFRILKNKARQIGDNIAIHAVSLEIDVDTFTQTQLDVPIHAVKTDCVILEFIQRHADIPVDTVELGGTLGLGNFNSTVDSVDFDRSVNHTYCNRPVDPFGHQRDLTRQS